MEAASQGMESMAGRQAAGRVAAETIKSDQFREPKVAAAIAMSGGNPTPYLKDDLETKFKIMEKETELQKELEGMSFAQKKSLMAFANELQSSGDLPTLVQRAMGRAMMTPTPENVDIYKRGLEMLPRWSKLDTAMKIDSYRAMQSLKQSLEGSDLAETEDVPVKTLNVDEVSSIMDLLKQEKKQRPSASPDLFEGGVLNLGSNLNKKIINNMGELLGIDTSFAKSMSKETLDKTMGELKAGGPGLQAIAMVRTIADKYIPKTNNRLLDTANKLKYEEAVLGAVSMGMTPEEAVALMPKEINFFKAPKNQAQADALNNYVFDRNDPKTLAAIPGLAESIYKSNLKLGRKLLKEKKTITGESLVNDFKNTGDYGIVNKAKALLPESEAQKVLKEILAQEIK